MFLKIILRCCLAAASFTLMLVALVFTTQARDARQSAPQLIGQERQEVSFLQEFTTTRQEMVFSFLREQFPQLDLPEAEPDPLSLQALRARTERN